MLPARLPEAAGDPPGQGVRVAGPATPRSARCRETSGVPRQVGRVASDDLAVAANDDADVHPVASADEDRDPPASQTSGSAVEAAADS